MKPFLFSCFSGSTGPNFTPAVQSARFKLPSLHFRPSIQSDLPNVIECLPNSRPVCSNASEPSSSGSLSPRHTFNLGIMAFERRRGQRVNHTPKSDKQM